MASQLHEMRVLTAELLLGLTASVLSGEMHSIPEVQRKVSLLLCLASVRTVTRELGPLISLCLFL